MEVSQLKQISFSLYTFCKVIQVQSVSIQRQVQDYHSGAGLNDSHQQHQTDLTLLGANTAKFTFADVS